MLKEPSLIIKRRFMSRILESGLLIIAIALGVGTASSGLSLYFNTLKTGKELLDSPQYKEIVVTSRSNIHDMDYPLLETAAEETVLTIYDLSAGEITPNVTYSYIIHPSRLKMINSGNNEMPSGPGMNIDNSVDLEEIKNNPSIIFSNLDEIYGNEVTSHFFNARGLEASEGSLFSANDYTSTENLIVLGSELAKKLKGEDEESLIGKKLPAWNGLHTVVGILKESGSDYDNKYFSPKKTLTSNSKFMRRSPGEDSQLRFYITDVSLLEKTANQLTHWFKIKYGDSQISVSNPREEVKNTISRNKGVSALILFLSLTGLFIASVNVSNILMGRAIRMKKHVGILKALGASQKTITKLFAQEAISITLLGTIIGTLFAIPLSNGMEKSMGLDSITWIYTGLGVLLSFILTFVFSVFPAKLNSRINPADAMRE